MNPERLDFGQYRIQRVLLNGKAIVTESQGAGVVRIARELLPSGDYVVEIKVFLSR
ncbi:MAG: hypothetical protein HGA80_09635 [Candidatus Omnitrophica bacterium]|nr:hypothetical protein [Candidatus Omnitrophota bacterium]